jgi:hypothetical protein
MIMLYVLCTLQKNVIRLLHLSFPVVILHDVRFLVVADMTPCDTGKDHLIPLRLPT